MKSIALTRGQYAIVDDDDFEWLSQWKWMARPDRTKDYFYAVRGLWREGKVKTVRMASLLLPPRDGFVVDHINNNTLDNRRCNLRYATRQQNNFNQRVREGRFKGVFLEKRCKSRPWFAAIRYNRKLYKLGYFATPDEAALYYNVAAQLFFGEFAKLNDV